MAGQGWRWLIRGLGIGLAFLLGGCFQADLTLQFDHHHHGQWTQTLTLGERNLAVAQDALDPWLSDLRDSVGPLGGSLRQTPDTLALTVPFSTPADLVDRFQTLLTPPSPGGREPGSLRQRGADDPMVLVLPALGTVPVHLQTRERNWGLVSQVWLGFDLDLRSVESPRASVGGDDAREAGLSFRLQVPWGLSRLTPDSLEPSHPHGSQWNLPLGQLSHIEARFWLPNWVGLGGVALVILVLLGYRVRYRWLGPPRA